MKLRTILATTLVLGVGLGAFWLYSTGRTMTESMGLRLQAVLGGVFLAGLFLSPVLAGLVVAIILRARLARRLLALVLLSGFLPGIALGEGLCLLDEARFAKEVQEAETTGHDTYSRARAWPNASGGLLWSRTRGTWATD